MHANLIQILIPSGSGAEVTGMQQVPRSRPIYGPCVSVMHDRHASFSWCGALMSSAGALNMIAKINMLI